MDVGEDQPWGLSDYLSEFGRHWSRAKVGNTDSSSWILLPKSQCHVVCTTECNMSVCLSVQVSHRKPPPAVVPYSRHVEGKKKLVESLDAMYNHEGTSNRFSAEVPIGVLLSFSPPDTPPNDRSESASLCSKDSIEVAQTEVVTANLVDLGPEVKEEEGEGVEKQTRSPIEDETESESVISSDSSRASPTLLWADSHVIQNHNTASPPPIPPPRTKRQPKASVKPSNVQAEHQLPPFYHPAQFGPRPSPFDDFSSSIAAALIDNSKRYTDPQAASTLSVTGMDLFKAVDGARGSGPVCSSIGIPTASVSTDGDGRPSSAPPSSSPPTPMTNDPWKPLTQQQAPLLASQKVKRLPPPIKPQPYGGSGAKAFLPSPSDPFSDLDLFGSRGMREYAKADSEHSGTS